MISFYTSMIECDADKDKVAYIYENFYSFMSYNAKQVLVSDAYLVEDAVHAAMITVIENLDLIDLEDTHKAKNFCAVIARNKARDFCREKDGQNLSLEDETFKNLSNGDDPSEIVIRKDTYDVILKAIDSLSDTYKDVCMLKYINNLSERQIARLLNLSPKAVSLRIFRSRQILKKMLRKENLHV